MELSTNVILLIRDVSAAIFFLYLVKRLEVVGVLF